ncbi:MAG: hypothetical protein AAF810_24740 [Cyanobacteria bacterium P01_D01_bin.36]
MTIAQLTDRIDTYIQTYLSLNALNSLTLINRSHNRSTPFPPPSSQDLDLSPLDLSALDLSAIATAYSKTCSLIWQQSLTPTPPHPSSSQRHTLPQQQSAFPPTPHLPTPHLPTLQPLCHHWATTKLHHPNAPFFQNALTLGALRSKWRYPAIQASLRHTTDSLRQLSPYDEWLAAYPTCWAYTVGRTMHQLLQWNYRLTPAILREFLILD